MGENVLRKPKIWFLTPSVNSAAGGINHFYRLCELAEELGIEAYVLSETVYPCCDPPHLNKYWREIEFSHYYQGKYDYAGIQDGDIIIQPEIYNWQSLISKKVRRITYIQNWALADRRSWQKHYWTYNNTVNLTYSINNAIRNFDVGYSIVLPPPGEGDMDIKHVKPFMDSQKITWSLVSPYFNPDEFSFGENDSQKILMFPRKSAWIAEEMKSAFGDNLMLVDGLQPSEVIDLYKQVGIVVLPSPAEGLCFPAIESMLSGAVVVSWPCGAPEEFLIDGITGMMAEFGNIEDLASKISFLLQNPEKRKEIAINARKLAEQLFSRERSKMELFIAYHRACTYKSE
jgi:glycosyltransferase involved in cell wall biosynthesis